MRRFLFPLFIGGMLAIMGRTMRRWFIFCTAMMVGFIFTIGRHPIDPVTGGGRYSMTVGSWFFLVLFIVGVAAWWPLVAWDRSRRRLAPSSPVYVQATAERGEAMPELRSVEDLGPVPETEVDPEPGPPPFEGPAPVWIPTHFGNSPVQRAEETTAGMLIRDRRAVDPDAL